MPPVANEAAPPLALCGAASCRVTGDRVLVQPPYGAGWPPWRTKVTWLILPVVICLSQRLSHACLSISNCTAKLRMAH
jgi:hypothetical protein